MRARWRNRQRKRRAIVAVQISIARMTTAQTRMDNRILGQEQHNLRAAPAFLRINNIMLFFCLLSLECYIEKDERMA